MSPASQGALEVERYIGSCLISSSARPSATGKSLISSVIKKPQENVVSRVKQQRDYQQQSSYTSGGEQCQYGTWAGAPLISMTSGPRRNNQRSSPPPVHQSSQQQQSQQQSPQQQQQNQGQQIQTHLPNRTPLSRLAIHTQGAPLILAGRFHNRVKIQSCAGMNANNVITTTNANANNFCNNNTNIAPVSAVGNPMITSTGRCVPARGQRLADAQRKPQQPSQPQQHQPVNPKQECATVKVENNGQNIANIDSLSIASDESSGSANSENSLPRIIKPRKRRKKDRKPASGAAMPDIQSKPEDHHQPLQQQQPHQQQQQQQHNQHSQHPSNTTGISDHSSIVTLKPYVPVCYDTRYDRGHRRPPAIARESYPRSQSQTTSCTGSMQQHQPIQEIVDTRQPQQQQQQRYGQRHVQVKVVDDNRNVIVPTTPSSSSMPVRSMGMTTKGNSSSYHHRNQLHHVAHHHYHHHHHHSENLNGNNNNGVVVANGKGMVPPVSRNRYVHHQPHHQHQQQHQIHHQHQHPLHAHDFNEPMLMGCEDTALVDVPSGSAGCQCRYCDPSGLIWDVDQNGYSPFLTPPHASEFPGTTDYGLPNQQQHQFANLPLFLSRAGSAVTCQKQSSSGCEYYELADSTTSSQRVHNNRHVAHHQEPRCGNSPAVVANKATNNNSCNVQASSTGAMLRRSWSDPTSYFSDEISVPNRDVGVIGDRGQAEVTRGRSSWPGGGSASGINSANRSSSPYGNLANLPISSQGLEVSTEIVTSPNGHRDLEIKFYSSSPCAQPAEEDKSAFLDDGEDFSDIWSYHESKLQQDFRTLLQAEE